MKKNLPLILMILACLGVTTWSLVNPLAYDVWFFEIAAGLIGVVALALTFQRFRFSNLAYFLICIHFIILAIAAKYTYAEMPLFNWLRDTFELSRNYYDRVGHFMQGFVPAIIAREIFIRTGVLKSGKMAGFICVCVCLAISAFWELLEWWVAVLFYPESGPEWLGMQGDMWDAQGDMMMALIGAILAILLLSRLHDRSMKKIVRGK
ncbi:MAG: DUF2238 domain-containing protein [Planctomycetes bacterium]|nr:DUF2238 domain-containing protein [Planctomycetota bacterium]